MSFATVLQRLAQLDNPYPGLRPFETSESHLFFGRDQQVLDLCDRLTRNRFVAVLGLSGSGKSSLVRAGLIPALERGRLLEPGHTWRIAQCRPSGNPFSNLAAALNCNPVDLRSSSHALIQLAGNEQPLLVLIDQFEELFRYKERIAGDSATPSEAAAFISLLLASSRSPLPIYVVITMRTDYLGDCAEFPEFPEALNESQYLVPRLTREQRRQAIEGPLGRVQVSSALVEQILNDAGDEPDQLPILQHALMRTWAHWRKYSPENERPIDSDDYQAIGGFAGALNQHANELLQSAADPQFAEIIFKRLTALGRSNRERRDPAQLSELWELCNAFSPEKQYRVNAVINAFRQGHATFLAPRDGDLAPHTYIDIAHESLIRNWRLLAETWLPEEEKQAKTLIELVDRARGWQAGTRDLLVGLDLSSALDWKSHINPSPKWAEHYAGPGAIDEVESFLSASHRKFEDGQRREHERLERELTAEKQLRETAERKEELIRSSARRTQIFSYVLALLLLGALALALVAWRSSIQAREQRKLAESSARRALEQQKVAEFRKEVAQSAEFRALEQQKRAEFQKTLAVVAALKAQSQEEAARSANIRALAEQNLAESQQTLAEAATLKAQNQQKLAESRELAARAISLVSQGKRGEALASALDGFSIQKTLEARDAIAHAFPQELATLEGHSGMVLSASFSPDGQRVLTTSTDGTARVWNAATGQSIVELVGPVMMKAAFSPDGDRVAAASRDDTVRVWDAADGRLVAALAGPSYPITDIAFSPDGNRIVTASTDSTARIWNARTGQLAAELKGHSTQLLGAAFSADGQRVVTGSADGTARVWDATSGQAIAKMERAPGSIMSEAFSRDGQRVVTASTDRTASVWNAATGHMIAKLEGHSGTVRTAEFSPDGQRVVTASWDGTARVWNAATGDIIAKLEGHSAGVNSATFSPDGQYILTASFDKTARVWNVATGQVVAKLEGHSDRVLAAAFSPDGKRIVTAGADKTARVWNIAANGKVVATEKRTSFQMRSLGFSRDRQRSIFANGGNTARVSDTVTNTPITTLEGHSGKVVSAALSPDGQRAITGSVDQTARIWNAKTGQPIVKLEGHSDSVGSVAFSPDGQRVVTASDDHTARVWNAVTGETIMKLEGHSGYVIQAAFSPDGRYIATASSDNTARVWDAATGRLIAKLEGLSTWAMSAAFSEDSRSIEVESDIDHTALIFRIVTLDEITRLLASK